MSEKTSEKRTPFRLDQLGYVGRGRSRSRPRNDPSLFGGPYPYFQTGDIKAANLYLYRYSQTFNEKGLAQSKLWEPGTLCITIAANIAETAILKIRGCFPDSVVGFIPDPEKADIRFVKYYIDFIKLHMQNISHGTAQDNLSLDKLLSFDFLMPSLKIQRKIATILSTYDDLIENNLCRIQILEEMAETIYHEWFVNLRFPGHEDVQMIDSPMGKIPEGWEIKKAGDVLKRLKTGAVYTRSTVSPVGRIPVIDQSRSEALGFHNNNSDHVASLDNPIAIFGDHTCRMHLMVEPFSVGPNVIAFVAQNDLPIAYVYFVIHNLIETEEYKRHWIELTNRKIVVSGKREAEDFAKLVKPIFKLIACLRKKNLSLRRTRDLFLPKLISGEISIGRLETVSGGLRNER